LGQSQQETSILGHLFGKGLAPRVFRRWMAVLLILAAFLTWKAYIGITRIIRSHTKQQVIVCIDPGHPSETNSGRLPQNGTSELEMNWIVATKLETLLNRDKRFRAFKVRKLRDEVMRNRERAVIANDAKADLAIHIHCDAGPSHGYTIYYPDRVGRAEGQKGPSKEVLIWSRKAAFAVHEGMQQDLSGVLRDRGAKSENFTKIGHAIGALTTSVFSEVPTITVEMVFLNNVHDADFIKSRAGQEKMAQALADGIAIYLRPQLKKLGKDPSIR
jgi:N-acetylmuramoyl-L-alanine amidase